MTPPASGRAARQAVVFLHGYGSNGDDLIGLAPYFAQGLPDAVFYSPHAPFPWEGGFFGGKQWFSLAGYEPDKLRTAAGAAELDRDFFAGAEAAAAHLDPFLESVLARHQLPAAKLALVGFSQGTMMALHVALRRKPALAGVVGFSGALVGARRLARDIAARPPVLLVHGANDPVVPVEAMAGIVAALKANAVPVESHVIPGLEHGIDGAGAALAAKFLQEKLA
jgi:phospholipase/carboxylesterase